MGKFGKIALLSIACQSTLVLGQNGLRNGNGNGNGRGRDSDNDCVVYLKDTQFENGYEEEGFVCGRSDGSLPEILGDGPEELKNLKKNGKFKSGKTTTKACQFKGNGR